MFLFQYRGYNNDTKKVTEQMLNLIHASDRVCHSRLYQTTQCVFIRILLRPSLVNVLLHISFNRSVRKPANTHCPLDNLFSKTFSLEILGQKSGNHDIAIYICIRMCPLGRKGSQLSNYMNLIVLPSLR